MFCAGWLWPENQILKFWLWPKFVGPRTYPVKMIIWKRIMLLIASIGEIYSVCVQISPHTFSPFFPFQQPTANSPRF